MLPGVMLALILGSGASGCARRIVLDPPELSRVEALPQGISALRVYASETIVLVYPSAKKAQSYDVDRTIRDKSNSSSFELIVSRKTPGLVIDEDQSNGQRRLWVTFDPSCRKKDCAFGFVLTEEGEYALAELPSRRGYAEPVAFIRRPKKKFELKRGRLHSLAEANEVWVRGQGKDAQIVYLEAKKKVARGHRRSTTRSRGID